MKQEVMSNLEQEAKTAQMMIEAEGGRAFVFCVSIKTDYVRREPRYDVRITRGISSGTTKGEALSYIEALQREIARIGKLIGGTPETPVA